MHSNKRIISMFGELSGEQLFTLDRNDFNRFCEDEAAHLDSQIRVQKSLCGVSDFKQFKHRQLEWFIGF